MRKIVSVLLLITTCLFAENTEVKKDSTVSYWSPKGVMALNISQLSLSNWSQGGDDALTWTLTGDFGYNYKDTSWSFNNNLKISFGKTKIGSNGFRINDNEIYLENVLTRNVGWTINPFFSNTFRTSLTSGYKYENSNQTQIVDFFDPGYLTQSLGFTYKNQIVNTRLGMALQQTFTNRFRNFSDDGATLDRKEAFKLEAGLETVSNLSLKVENNLLYKSLFRLFTRFDHIDVWDVRLDNTLTAKVTKFVNVNLNVLLIYEKKQSARTQLKEALQLGFVYTLF